MTADGFTVRVLSTLDPSAEHSFSEPCKKIHESQDVSTFLTSKAYVDLMTFLLQLNRSLFPAKLPDGSVRAWPLRSDAVEFSAPIRGLQDMLSKLEEIIEEAPPDTGPRRFGNVSFRKWYQIVESRASQLLDECLAPEVLRMKSSDANSTTVKSELLAYFMGSWGSAQRLDYGTGHELSFLAFLAGIWKLNGFPKTSPGVEERAIVLGVIQPYLELVRSLIKTYTLEPAGSHGVWGLDDHSFIPYIFGSAQLAPAMADTDRIPEEGSLPDAPDPNSVTKVNIVERERKVNLYFSAIGFIYDVKKGPFWEHSPMLFDISGIRAGWAKINKGMIKMYNAEVLSKFPVVQHFPFGSLFSWERDPNATPPPPSIHAASGPQSRPESTAATSRPAPSAGTKAPWASTMRPPPPGSTATPWAATKRPGVTVPDGSSRIPTALPDTSRLPAGPMAPTKAGAPPAPLGTGDPANVQTKAPWAKP